MLTKTPNRAFFLSLSKTIFLWSEKNTAFAVFLIRGGATGTRTLDPMIKSHLLYQLSYSPKTFLSRCSAHILTHKKTKIKKIYQKSSFFIITCRIIVWCRQHLVKIIGNFTPRIQPIHNLLDGIFNMPCNRTTIST